MNSIIISNLTQNWQTKLTNTISFVLVLLFTNLSYASQHNNYVIDIFGTNKINAKLLALQYKNEFEIITKYLMSSNPTKENTDKFCSAMINLKSKIKERHGFYYVNISPIKYNDREKIYITVDVASTSYNLKNTKEFTSIETTQATNELINSWYEYEKIGLAKEFLKHKIYLTSCSKQLCLFGFFDKDLLSREKQFLLRVESEKYNLLNILKNESNEKKRAAAAYLLSYQHNPNLILSMLTPSLSDPSSMVRNNVMRVIGAVLSKNRELSISLENLNAAIKLPDTTDRNKALFILLQLSKRKENKLMIKNQFGKELITALKMLQPNIHITSYIILKQISGMKYSDRDYKAWEKWIES